MGGDIIRGCAGPSVSLGGWRNTLVSKRSGAGAIGKGGPFPQMGLGKCRWGGGVVGLHGIHTLHHLMGQGGAGAVAVLLQGGAKGADDLMAQGGGIPKADLGFCGVGVHIHIIGIAG